MKTPYKSIETRAVHAGEPQPRIGGALVLPIFESSTYEYTPSGKYSDIKYIRLSNSPNHAALNAKLAALENAEAAMVTGSGMSAIATALMAFLKAGDHVIAHKSLYGATNDLLTKDLKAFDIGCTFIDAGSPGGWERALTPRTKIFYLETITNPTLEVPDIPAVVDFAKQHGLISMIDNTFASPFNFRPAEHGIDLSIHSATKYLNGHTDLCAGVVIGRGALIEKVIGALVHYGGFLDPNACARLHRGVKTMPLRVRYQNESALRLATFLAGHPQVAEVKYPGLPGHPQHERARALLDGFGGMVSFVPRGGVPAAERFLERVRLATNAPSLGGVETLVSMPLVLSHMSLTPEERERAGIIDSLIRVSVGIEGTEELIEDFDQALQP